jgi:hypothetical protein
VIRRPRYRRAKRPVYARTWFLATDWALAAVAVGGTLLGIITGFGVPA